MPDFFLLESLLGVFSDNTDEFFLFALLRHCNIDRTVALLPQPFTNCLFIIYRVLEEQMRGNIGRRIVILFHEACHNLVGSFSLLVEKLAPGGSLWISWLKPSSKLKGGGQPGDLNEDVVRRIGLTHGLVDVNLAVLDRDWSALRLVRRKR